MNRSLTTSVLLVILSFAVQAQEDEKASIIQQAVELKNFVFKAESVTPQRGRMRQLTTDYDLTVRPDTIIAFLPYFGRAYSAPVNSSEGGIKFTSSSFEYSFEKKKKNRWEITIKLKDVSDVQNLFMTVFDNGSASLQVSSNNKEGISYNGIVKEGKPIDKKGF